MAFDVVLRGVVEGWRAMPSLRSLGLPLGLSALCVLYVNPLRETAVFDDWAYAWTVRNWLATGEYRLHDWLSANMPFQATWGALFCHIGGFSFSVLRISTLALVVPGMIAFFHLAREHGLAQVSAGLLTLGLMASPLVVRLGFSFMTDVPFLMLVSMAVLLYTRAIRLHSLGWMLAASGAASAAVLTRQFGIALIAGLFCVWIFHETERRRPLLYLAGAMLPSLAGAWQVYSGLAHPNWFANNARLAQAEYFAAPLTVAWNALLRVSPTLHYLVLFSAPLVLVGLLSLVRANFSFGAKTHKALRVLLLAGGATGVAAALIGLCAHWLGLSSTAALHYKKVSLAAAGLGLSFGCCTLLLRLPSTWILLPARNRDRLSWPQLVLIGAALGCLLFMLWYSGKWFMPYWGWCGGLLAKRGLAFRVLLLLFTISGALVLLRVFGYRYWVDWRKLSVAERYLDVASAFLLIEHLVFYQIGDEYLLGLLPWLLIVLGRHLAPWLMGFRTVAGMACVAMLVVSSAWTRTELAAEEAAWRGAELARQHGVPAEKIAAQWTWLSYYRFPDYLQETGFAPQSDLDDFFQRWLPRQNQDAEYSSGWIPPSAVPTEWEVFARFRYRDGAYCPREWVVWKKRHSIPVTSELNRPATDVSR